MHIADLRSSEKHYCVLAAHHATNYRFTTYQDARRVRLVEYHLALTIALSLAVARDRRKQGRHAVRVDTWLCESITR